MTEAIIEAQWFETQEGLEAKAREALARAGIKRFIVLDNGIDSFSAAEKAIARHNDHPGNNFSLPSVEQLRTLFAPILETRLCTDLTLKTEHEKEICRKVRNDYFRALESVAGSGQLGAHGYWTKDPHGEWGHWTVSFIDGSYPTLSNEHKYVMAIGVENVE